ncbi:MAG: DegV family protein [Chloroflexales bacterium]|nr:DegV family protein [Chloroflexales bacterium]
MVKVVVDSCADMPEALVKKYGITVVPLAVQFGRESLRDGVEISHDEFYRRLAATQATSMPKTSQPALGEFEQTYRELLRDGDGVVSIHISGKLSGTVRAAQQAADMVDPARIRVVDSGQAVMTQGYMAIAAVEAASRGASLDEIVAQIARIAERGFIYVGLDTLRYIQQGGRIGRMQAFLGTLLSVKPIFEVKGGEVQPQEQVRSAKRMAARLGEMAQAQAPLEELAVLYTTGEDQARQLADQIAAAGTFPRDKIVVAQMGAVIGTHIGPGGLGVNGIRKT